MHQSGRSQLVITLNIEIAQQTESRDGQRRHRQRDKTRHAHLMPVPDWMLITSYHETPVHINSITIKRMGLGLEGKKRMSVCVNIAQLFHIFCPGLSKLCTMFVQVCYILRETRLNEASAEGLLLLVVKSRLLSLHQRELERIIFVKPGGAKGTGRRQGR